jgi:hypothetical protein
MTSQELSLCSPLSPCSSSFINLIDYQISGGKGDGYVE